MNVKKGIFWMNPSSTQGLVYGIPDDKASYLELLARQKP